jgi:REP element-mobilizing transposase RayT
MTQRFKRLSHSIYECKCHIVFCPKYRYGYCTIGVDEEKIWKYVQWQEQQEKQAEAAQGKLFE